MERLVDHQRLTLDFGRARAWLAANRGAPQLDREAPYQWLVSFFHELVFPGNDPRWRTAPLRALIYLSWELKHRNFLFRRAFPFELSLLELSQFRPEDGGLVPSLENGELVYLDTHDTIQSVFHETCKPSDAPQRCLAVPVVDGRELQGVILLVHTHDATPSPDIQSMLLEIGRSVGEFSTHYLLSRKSAGSRPGK